MARLTTCTRRLLALAKLLANPLRLLDDVVPIKLFYIHMLRLPSQRLYPLTNTPRIGSRIVFRSSNLFNRTVIFRQFIFGKAGDFLRLGPFVVVHRFGDLLSYS
jgi:hypothetical protein